MHENYFSDMPVINTSGLPPHPVMIILLLQVRIWRQGENVRTATDYDCGRRTWIIIDDNFQLDTTYNLRVFGYSRGGVGKMSSPLIKFVLGESASSLNQHPLLENYPANPLIVHRPLE